MIKISINDNVRNFEDVNPNWIHEQVRGRLKEGIPVCVVVQVKKPGIDLSVSCGDCSSGSGGRGRAPNPEERRVFDLWEELGCKHSPVNPGNIVAFLNHVKNF